MTKIDKVIRMAVLCAKIGNRAKDMNVRKEYTLKRAAYITKLEKMLGIDYGQATEIVRNSYHWLT